MSEVTLGEIADLVGGTYDGPRSRRVVAVAPLSDASEQHLSFLANPRYKAAVRSSRAAAVLVRRDFEEQSERFIRVDDPYFAMSRVVSKWFAYRPAPRGISPRAFIDPSATLGAGVAVGPFTSIGDDVIIGDGVTIYSHVAIEPGVRIGDGTVVYPQVSIYHGSIIGSRCILHSGVVVGSDGYGFATHEGRHHKIPQVGIVRIEDDVELGAGTCVDRAALGETVIGEGTKVDNLVQIGHNVRIGKHCLLVAQVGLAGSTELGDYVAMGGQAGAAGHLEIGSFAQIAAKSAVFDDVPAKTKVMGIPAAPFREVARRDVWIRRLPDLARRLEELEKNL
jgi:UDP-3-O-[3-hydroxymyristoyl] glucosamine N-acyltransferase